MVHNPHTPNVPTPPIKQLNPNTIRHVVDERGRTVIHVPDGQCSDSLGDCIETALGRPLDGGPLFVVGG